MSAATQTGLEPGPVADGTAWHTVTLADVFSLQHVDESTGLTSAEVTARRQRYGPNRLSEAKKEPRWRAFVRQYADPMQIVLVVAGVLSMYPIKQYGTALVM